MFPYRDDNPTLATPIVTIALIAANAAVWVLVQGAGLGEQLPRSVCSLGLIPGEFLGTLPGGTAVPLSPGTVCVLGDQRRWFAPVTSMFMHGGWLHLLGNMWFLWLFGNNTEDSMGRGRFLAFYVLCGLAAAAAQLLVTPRSPIPMVGASGAISGVMGAYVLLYPRVRIHMLIVLVVFITRIVVPAYFMLGYWFLLQLLGGTASLGADRGGTAFWAHVGGFLAGIALIPLFKDPALVQQHRQQSLMLRRGQLWAGDR